MSDYYPGYPVLLNLHQRRCVIVGGGKVGARKAQALLRADALVTVISPQVDPAWDAMITDTQIAPRLTLQQSAYESGMLQKWSPFLVFAATNSAAVNLQVVQDAHQLGILVDSVDSSDLTSDLSSDFSSMASVQRGPITLAVATSGASPALTVHLKTRLAATFGSEYGTLANWLAELRPLIQQKVNAETERRRFWNLVIDSAILDLLRQEDFLAARTLLDNLLAHFLSGSNQ